MTGTLLVGDCRETLRTLDARLRASADRQRREQVAWAALMERTGCPDGLTPTEALEWVLAWVTDVQDWEKEA